MNGAAVVCGVRQFVLRPDPADAAPVDPLAGLSLEYAAALDAQQLAAVTAGPGVTLVVAGAGTGKTRTIVYRLAYLVETGTPADRMALLTFTRRAAREMVGRAAALVDGRASGVRGGTFHSVCVEILRVHAERLGLPRRFTILDAADSADVLDLLRTERGLDASAARFPRKRTLQGLFSAVANRGVALDDLVAESYPQLARHLDALHELQTAFVAAKHKLGLVDYDDLLAHTVRLLTEHADVRQHVAGRLRHVLVDEYQDVNGVQADLVALLASVHGNLTLVGDEAQSIYGFRGASVRHILDVPQRYPGARVLKLERNYRSVQPILDLANHVQAGASEGYAKHLVSDKGDGARPVLVQAPDDEMEARFVAQMVLDAREADVPLDRQAVLFRASWCSYTLEAELTRRGIPFVKIGGLKLAEAAHVKDVVAHLRVAENPADTVAWNRVLRLIEGVGPATARKLLAWVEAAATDGEPGALQAAFGGLVPGGPAAAGVARLGALLANLGRSEAPTEQQVERLLTYYRPVFERVYADDVPHREADLDAVAALAARHRTRGALLEALALDPLDWSAGPAEGVLRDEPPLVLSTIHSAKGLEFDTVFLIHALDGVLPSQYAVRTAAETDEERRLLYVALTRAERELYVSVPLVQYGRRTGAFLTEPSRFLTGVPAAVLEPASLVDEAAPPVLPAASDPLRLGPGEA